MVLTRKFSEFANAGDIANDDVTVGISALANAQFNNPWTFLPPGTTGERPAVDPDMYFRLRLNTDLEQYEYYDPVTANWVIISVADAFAWELVSASQIMEPEHGYITDSGSLVELTLPSSADLGTELGVVGRGSGGWKILQNAGQQIVLGSNLTTAGVTGYLEFTNRFDSLHLVCVQADLIWQIWGGPQGIITVA